MVKGENVMKKNEKNVDLYSIRYKNSMKPVDWTYYTKFYPNKPNAIQALRLDTGLGLAEAKDVIDEIFARLNRGEVKQREANAEHVIEPNTTTKDTLKKAGKGAAAVGGLTAYFGLGVIAKLTSKYMK